MFEDSLIESSGRLKTKRGLTTTIATSLLVIVIGIFCLVPLLYPEVLPKTLITTFLVAPPPPPPPPPPVAVVKVAKIETELDQGALRTPTKIPEKIKMVKEEEAPPAESAGIPGGVAGGVPGGSMGGVIGSLLGGTGSVPKVTLNRVRVSAGVVEGNLIHKVVPLYPPLAKTARIQGTVVLHAIISKQGNVENLNVISGHPMLMPAAVEAVKQWKYKPYILNGEPVEVETTVTVNFNLTGGA
ncbi:MAG TPA: energy transducer TonB [Terriglobales bacterium]|jgi:protein TonB|nr:energy transducer TonB [Terriglobales bacterium]